MIDAGAGNAVQSRRLRRYRKPAQHFLVEPDPKKAAKLRFEYARKRGITVVQVALGAEATEVDDIDVDRLDDWTLTAPLTFIRLAVGDAWLGVLRGASAVIRRDRPIIGAELGSTPARLAELLDFAAEHELATVDLFGNVVSTTDVGEVLTYAPALVLIPAEMIDRGAHIRHTLRAEVLPAVVNHRASRERLKRWLGY